MQEYIIWYNLCLFSIGSIMALVGATFLMPEHPVGDY